MRRDGRANHIFEGELGGRKVKHTPRHQLPEIELGRRRRKFIDTIRKKVAQETASLLCITSNRGCY